MATRALTVPQAMNAALARLWVAKSVAVILREMRGQSYSVLDMALPEPRQKIASQR
jgi:hypothetical protein